MHFALLPAAALALSHLPVTAETPEGWSGLKVDEVDTIIATDANGDRMILTPAGRRYGASPDGSDRGALNATPGLRQPATTSR